MYFYLIVISLLPRVSAPPNALAAEDCRGVQFDQGQFRERPQANVSVNYLGVNHRSSN